jgi:hypothetical protein
MEQEAIVAQNNRNMQAVQHNTQSSSMRGSSGM